MPLNKETKPNQTLNSEINDDAQISTIRKMCILMTTL